VAYYKKRNHELYQARRMEAKAKKAPSYSGYVEKVALQPAPMSDDVEYNGNGNMGGDLQPPAALWRGDLGGVRRVDEDGGEPRPPYVPKERLIHFDLKGAPPKVDYLVKILKLSAELGATGVLMEYEDMFPFEGRLASVAATNHYSRKDVKTLLDTCAELGLEVIPLVQTFGHLEMLLKLPEFAQFRDVEEMPESICPCDPGAQLAVKELIRQVMELHPKAR